MTLPQKDEIDEFSRAANVNRTPPPLALQVRGLDKRFDRPAVDGLDLSVLAGEFYTLLGPNGAGKTTTLRLVAGLLKPDRGSIAVFGIDALADPIGARRIMAWVSDEPMIYEKLTPMEYLDFVAGLWAVDTDLAAARARDLLSWLGLAPHAGERCEQLSKGMRQKVALAGALVHEPKLIMLDEPFTGLALLVPILIVTAGQLGGGLAWLAVSGEDAPDLIASAPVPAAHVLRAKTEAVLGGIAVVFGPFVVMLAVAAPFAALVSLIGVVIAAGSATAIQYWFRTQARRSIFRRRQTSSRVATIAEALSSTGWAGTGALAATEPGSRLFPALSCLRSSPAPG